MYVNSNPISIEEVTKIVNDPGFETKLQYAKTNPASKISIDLVHKLKKHLSGSSARLPFTSFERNIHLSQLVAYYRHF
jgi:hypothetical protein